MRRRKAALDQPTHSSAARVPPCRVEDNMSTTRNVTELPGKLATGGITVIG